MRTRKIFLGLITIMISMSLALLLAELVFRILERREQSLTSIEGGYWMDDSVWGWKPTPGAYHHRTPEFDAKGTVNPSFMNDRAEDPAADTGKIGVLVLGDSHTFATGVSTGDTWAKQLEARLNERGSGRTYRTYNAGVTGYSMHQYLSRLHVEGPRLKPRIVVVGVSFATDFYDLLPPGRGGWIYGGDRQRDYYDFDDSGRLTRRHWAPAPSVASVKDATPPSMDMGQSLRGMLDNLATFRYLRRSRLFLIIGSKVRIGGQSLWPNMEVAMEKEVSPAHEYQHRLFQALLGAMKSKADSLQARLVVVGIPYLPQVYEDLQRQTFSDAKYDAMALNRRVSAYCQALGVGYVDTQAPLRAKYREVGHWLHFPKDAHPTAEGHAVIADAIVRSGLMESALPLSTGSSH